MHSAALRANRVFGPYSKRQLVSVWPPVSTVPLTVALVCDTLVADPVVTVGGPVAAPYVN